MTAVSDAATEPLGNKVKAYLGRWESLLGILTILLLIVSAATTAGFATGLNFSYSLSLMSEKALFVLPLALLIIVREIDISVASIAALAAGQAGLVLKAGHPLVLAIIVAVVTGILCGALNGFCVAFLGMPSLVVTLGTLALYRGLCYVFVGNDPINAIPKSLITLGNDDIARTYIPLDIVPFLVLAPLFAVLLHKLVTGRRLYAMGGNPETARYSGIRDMKLRFLLFVGTGAVCSLAGIINLGRVNQATPDAMFGYELDAITIVFLGGISFLGGKGRISGVVWALILLVTLRSVLQLHNVSEYAQGTAVGVLLIVSLLLANFGRRITAAVDDRRSRRAGPPDRHALDGAARARFAEAGPS